MTYMSLTNDVRCSELVLSLGCLCPACMGTVMIGERGKFVARWGPKHTVRINMRVPRDRYIWKDSQKQWL